MSSCKHYPNRQKSRCMVKGCARNILARLHCIPISNPYIKKQWMKSLRLVDWDFKRRYFVCGEHFKESDYDEDGKRLRRFSVPSVNLPTMEHTFYQKSRVKGTSVSRSVLDGDSLLNERLVEYAQRSGDLLSIREEFIPKSEVDDTNSNSLSTKRMVLYASRSGDLSSVKRVYNVTMKHEAKLSTGYDPLLKEQTIGYAKQTGDLSSIKKTCVKSKDENRQVSDSSPRVRMVGYAMRPGDSSSIKKIYLKTKARLRNSTIAEFSLGDDSDSSSSTSLIRNRNQLGDLSSVKKKYVGNSEAGTVAVSSMRGNALPTERMVGNAMRSWDLSSGKKIHLETKVVNFGGWLRDSPIDKKLFSVEPNADEERQLEDEETITGFP